ncbi:hypothetical protein R5R73_17840 [Salinicola sp. LHM]|uniref:hypothetical protein n=1 Tax=Salinicola sp. LHM TaxID=3065298 RepID=UPI002ACE29D1|nr:hypothetical protein [Salinicola sp. LHM]MEC8918345.1 hypothetical protein [Pseudomonadota bacterium]WQH32856.1 hypothetical protein R5R73_17840 [Salinicola sp. LHM]
MAAYEEETTRPRMLNLLIGVTLMTIVIALWYLLDYYYLRESTRDVTWYPPAQGCVLLEGGCHANLGIDSSLAFALQETRDGEDTLTFEVRVHGRAPQSVTVQFIGRDMNVQSRRLSLQSQGGGLFVGEGTLGLCSAHVDAWRAQVVVLSDHGLKGSWFDFDSQELGGPSAGRGDKRCL